MAVTTHMPPWRSGGEPTHVRHTIRSAMRVVGMAPVVAGNGWRQMQLPSRQHTCSPGALCWDAAAPQHAIAAAQASTMLAPAPHDPAVAPDARAAPAILPLPSRPTLGVVPGHRLGRQATLAKGFRLMQPPAALPLFDMSVAVIDSLNMMRASIEEEVVIQSTLGVPAHHALACRIEAYGTPFK